MVQDEKGLKSRCICPICFETCNACMGTEQQPISGDRFEVLARLRERYDSSFPTDDERYR